MHKDRRRVMISGVGAVSPCGVGYEALVTGLRRGHSCVQRMAELEKVRGLRSLVAAVVPGRDELWGL
ncbi:MAG: hypothetical protein D6820_10895, partial [Lentisphaerae bacterium]